MGWYHLRLRYNVGSKRGISLSKLTSLTMLNNWPNLSPILWTASGEIFIKNKIYPPRLSDPCVMMLWKGEYTQKMSFNHLQVIANVYDFLSSAEQKIFWGKKQTCMDIKTIFKHFSKYCLLCFTKEINKYRFKTTVNCVRIFIFWCTIPLSFLMRVLVKGTLCYGIIHYRLNNCTNFIS